MVNKTSWDRYYCHLQSKWENWTLEASTCLPSEWKNQNTHPVPKLLLMVALFFECSVRVGTMCLLLNPIVVPKCLAYSWNSINISWFIFTVDLPRFTATVEKYLQCFWECPVCLQKDREGIFTLNVGGIISYDGFPEVIRWKGPEEPHHSLPASLFQKLCNELLSCTPLWWFTFKLLPKTNPPLPKELLPGVLPQWREKWHIYWTH